MIINKEVKSKDQIPKYFNIFKVLTKIIARKLFLCEGVIFI